MQLTKAPITLLTLCIALTSTLSGAFGAEKPSDTGEKSSELTTAGDWFQIGGYLKTSEYMRFYVSIAGNLENVFTKISDLLVKEQCSKETLNALKGLVEVCKTSPINDPDHDWTNPELKSLWDAQGKLWAAVVTDFKKAPESTFFFWLGYHTFSLAWAVPNLRGDKDRIAKAIESAGTIFAALSNSETFKDVYSRLDPDVVHAMQVVMSVGSEIADPMADMTDADVSRAVEAGEAIRIRAKEHKLLKG
jgi:hypothetical protein